MTTALRTACRWALQPAPNGLGAAMIRWTAHVGNHASRAVAEKAGFTIDAETVQGTRGPKWSGALGAADLRDPGDDAWREDGHDVTPV